MIELLYYMPLLFTIILRLMLFSASFRFRALRVYFSRYDAQSKEMRFAQERARVARKECHEWRVTLSRSCVCAVRSAGVIGSRKARCPRYASARACANVD